MAKSPFPDIRSDPLEPFRLKGDESSRRAAELRFAGNYSTIRRNDPNDCDNVEDARNIIRRIAPRAVKRNEKAFLEAQKERRRPFLLGSNLKDCEIIACGRSRPTSDMPP